MTQQNELKDLIEARYNTNRVTYEQIRNLLDTATTEETVLHSKCLVVSYKLACGFTIRGEGSCVDPANFDLEIGRKVARQDAETQLWRLEGYRLQWLLFEQGLLE